MEDAAVRRRSGAREALADCLPLFLTAAVSVVTLLAVVFHGRTEAARGDRVLAALDPVMLVFRTISFAALESVFAHHSSLAAAASLLLAVVAATTLLRGGRRGLPVALLSFSAISSAWAEVFVLSGARVAGSLLFVAAVGMAAAAAVVRPLTATPGFPELRPGPLPPSSRDSSLPGWGESGGLLALFLLALATRAWAIDQIPSIFDEEMISVQTESRTLAGLRQFVRTEFVGTSNGLVTPLTNRLVFAGLGVSLYATRVTALVWGLVAVPLFWSLVRRLTGGALPAFGATLLFVCAPEQLFWSRSEVSVFAPIAALGIVFAHAGLSMVRRFGTAPVLLAAFLTPLCRFFYTAGHVFFAYPALLAAHAAVFAGGLRRRALLALPALLAGVAIWAASVSIAVAAAGGSMRFVDPAQVRGEPVWRAGFPATAPLVEVARGQAARVAANLASVWRSLSVNQEYATHWYVRFVGEGARTPMICLGLTVLAVAGLGFLLGQIRDARAVLVLFWLGLGLLPGVLSDEPDARRLSVIFVPILLLAILVLTAWVRLARETGGRFTGGLALAGAGLALGCVSWCGLSSDLLLPAAPLARDEQIRFARPLVEGSGVVLHNLFYRFGKTIEFGLLDQLLSPAGPCIQFVDRGDELISLLTPTCDYREEVYGLTLTREQIAARRLTRSDTDRVSYLFRDQPTSRRAVSVLPALDAAARVAERDWPEAGERLLAFDVNPGARRAAMAPETTPDGVRGGILVSKAGWYRLGLYPPCPGARVAIGTSNWDGASERPLLPGIFPFEISGPMACASSGRPELVASGRTAPVTPVLTGPALARIPEARGAEAASFAGWTGARTILQSEDLVADFGVDRENRVYALVLHDGAWDIRRFSPQGVETGRVRTHLPIDPSTATLLVGSDGACQAFSLRAFERFDAAFVRKSESELPAGVTGVHIARLPGDRLGVLSGSMLVILGPGGEVESRWDPSGGASGSFILPAAVVVGAGRLLVIEEAGDVHVFGFSGDPIVLRPKRRFTLPFAREPHPDFLRGSVLDGEMLIVPYSPDEAPLIVDLFGTRLMPAHAVDDLRRSRSDAPYRIRRGPRELFVLDSFTKTIEALTPGAFR